MPKVIAKEAAKKILLRSIKYLVLTFSFVRRNIPLQERLLAGFKMTICTE